MPVIAFVKPEPDAVALPTRLDDGAHRRLRRYGRMMTGSFIVVLTLWVILQVGCLLSLFLRFRSGIVVGTIDGTLAFRFWPAVDSVSPTHALAHEFRPRVYSRAVAIAYAGILVVASVPFCASLAWLAQLFGLYSRGEVFTDRNAAVMRRIGYALTCTGYSPLLLGPLAHLVGVLRPVTGVTDGMVVFFVAGLILLALSHVMAIGARLQQDQEDIL